MGWRIAAVVASEVIIEGPVGELLVYNPSIAFGDLIASIEGEAGHDTKGNTTLQGIASYGPGTSGFRQASVLDGGLLSFYYATSAGGVYLAAGTVDIYPTVGTGGPYYLDVLVPSGFMIQSSANTADARLFLAPSGDPSGATDLANINKALALGILSIAFLPGTFYINATLDVTGAGAVTLAGAGSGVTIVEQVTNNTPILAVAGQGQRVEGMTLRYTAQQGAADTSSLGIQFGDSAHGSCFESTFRDLFVELAYISLAVNPALSSTTVAGLFSCLFENIHVLGWYENAINLAGNAGGGHANCTGCLFNNIYLHNNFPGTSQPSNSYPVFLESWDEIIFNQLNIEHTECFIHDVIGLSGVGNCIINSLHLEEVQLSGSSGNSGYIALIGSEPGQTVVVNGMKLKFSTMSGTVDNPVFRFQATSGTPAFTALLTGFTEDTDNTFTTPAHPWVDFGSVANGVVIVNGVNVSQVDTLEINRSTGCYIYTQPPETFGAWQNLGAPAAGWSVAIAQYRLLPGGMVLVQIKNLQPPGMPPADATPIWTVSTGLPAGYQPANTQREICYGSAAIGTETPALEFEIDGSIQIFGVGGTTISRLDGTFLVSVV